jgi:NACHT domain
MLYLCGLIFNIINFFKIMDFSILKTEYEQAFKDAKFGNLSFLELCEMLQKVLNFPTDNSEFSNLSVEIGDNLSVEIGDNLLNAQNYDTNVLLMLLARVEVLGKKIICIVEGDLSNVPKDGGYIYLKEVLNHFNINEHQYLHIKKVKEARGKQIHNSILLTKKSYFILLEDVTLTVLQLISAKYGKLKGILCPETDFKDYLKEVVAEYELHQSIFTELEIKEYIYIDAKETLARNNNAAARRGNILEIRKQLKEANEQHFMLLGDAGMGKSTTLRWLAKGDAETLLANKKLPLPVYINLSSFTKADDTLFKRICQRLGRTEAFVKDKLEKQDINLFLDGFNEILPHLNNYLIRHLQSFIDEYPKLCICIASRPVAYEKITFKQAGQQSVEMRKPVPAFILQQMEKDLMSSFIDKNYKEKDKPTLISYLDNPKNVGLKDSLKNPLYLAEFLLVYKNDKSAINSTTDISKRFLFLKYTREYSKDKLFSQVEFHKLMAAYSQEISYNDTYGFYNPTVPAQHLYDLIKKFVKKNHYSLSVDSFILFAENINILVKDKTQNSYTFAHQSYQDFYNEEDF